MSSIASFADIIDFMISVLVFDVHLILFLDAKPLMNGFCRSVTSPIRFILVRPIFNTTSLKVYFFPDLFNSLRLLLRCSFISFACSSLLTISVDINGSLHAVDAAATTTVGVGTINTVAVEVLMVVASNALTPTVYPLIDTLNIAVGYCSSSPIAAQPTSSDPLTELITAVRMCPVWMAVGNGKH